METSFCCCCFRSCDHAPPLPNLLLHLLLNAMQPVMKARKEFGVEYPNLYATPGYHKEADAFNRVQRGHQAVLVESLPSFTISALVAGVCYPITMSITGIAWSMRVHTIFDELPSLLQYLCRSTLCSRREAMKCKTGLGFRPRKIYGRNESAPNRTEFTNIGMLTFGVTMAFGAAFFSS